MQYNYSYCNIVACISSGIKEMSVPNEITQIDLTTLKLRTGTVTLRAVNDIGASNHSNPVYIGKLFQTINIS